MTPKKDDDMVTVLLNRGPAFRDSQLARETLTRDDHELPYVVFGRFATFLNELFWNTPSPDEATVRARVRLLSEMENSTDQEHCESGFHWSLRSEVTGYNRKAHPPGDAMHGLMLVPRVHRDHGRPHLGQLA